MLVLYGIFIFILSESFWFHSFASVSECCTKYEYVHIGFITSCEFCVFSYVCLFYKLYRFYGFIYIVFVICSIKIFKFLYCFFFVILYVGSLFELIGLLVLYFARLFIFVVWDYFCFVYHGFHCHRCFFQIKCMCLYIKCVRVCAHTLINICMLYTIRSFLILYNYYILGQLVSC